MKGRRNSLDALDLKHKSRKTKKKLPVPMDPSSPTEDSPVVHSPLITVKRLDSLNDKSGKNVIVESDDESKTSSLNTDNSASSS